MDKVIYAIGDVHGRDDLLCDLHARIREYHRLMHSGRDVQLIHVGDDIDRGAQSRNVVDRLMSGVGDFELTCLLGNHEAMLLECLRPRHSVVSDGQRRDHAHEQVQRRSPGPIAKRSMVSNIWRYIRGSSNITCAHLSIRCRGYF